MKIEFEDGSFIQIDDKECNISLIQCAKSGKKLVMSSSQLSIDQVKQLAQFLNNWLVKEK